MPGCVEKVWDDGRWRHVPCGNKGKYEENGKHYCGTHAPSRIEARRVARGPARYELEIAARNKERLELAALRELARVASECTERMLTTNIGRVEPLIQAVTDYEDAMKGGQDGPQ